LKEEEGTKLRDKVLQGISASQKESVEHLLAIVTAKANVIKAFRS